jgi:NAD(P)-dependent dehydrogenase (short-subunit alcohol dehydrogenase family)
MKHSLIIGGTKGTGRAAARMFVNKNYKVSVIARTSPRNDGSAPYNPTLYMQADLAKDKILPLLDIIINRSGPVNYVVFCQRFRGKEDDWSNEIQVSLTATKTIIDYLTEKPERLAKDDKSVVMISSIASRMVISQQPLSYHMAKAGLETMVNYYSVILASKGVRFNAIIPGTIVKEESMAFYEKNPALKSLYTDNIPLGRMVNTEDIANLVDFLCSEKSSMLTGQKIILDGGISLIGQESLLLAKFNEG